MDQVKWVKGIIVKKLVILGIEAIPYKLMARGRT